MNPNALSRDGAGDGWESLSSEESFEEHLSRVENGKEERKTGLFEKAKERISVILHRGEWAKHNTEEIMRPSMKETEMGESVYVTKQLESLSEKIKEGRRVESSLISSCVFDRLETGIVDEKTKGEMASLEQFLLESGFGEGKNFDVKLPGFLYEADGTKTETPFCVSFEKPDGEFTEVMIDRDEDGKNRFVSWQGSREVADVSYRGPGRMDIEPKNVKFYNE